MFSIIYITAGDMPEARKIGRILVEERLAACANIFPITSIFRWKGNVDEASEFVIIVKTRTEKVKEIEKRVKEIHSYEVPCKIEDGSCKYLEWINDSVSCHDEI
jgi:periplasmic divalent cation tolerance protein